MKKRNKFSMSPAPITNFVITGDAESNRLKVVFDFEEYGDFITTIEELDEYVKEAHLEFLEDNVVIRPTWYNQALESIKIGKPIFIGVIPTHISPALLFMERDGIIVNIGN